MKKRLGELMLLNVLFAMLVIFIHVSSRPVMALKQDGLAYLAIMTCWRLSSFATQGFIFLSGFKMLYGTSEKTDLKKYYFGKITKVYFPYVLWVVLYYALFVFLKFLPQQNHITAVLKHILLGDLVGHLYFVPVIMQFYLLFPLWRILFRKIKPAYIISVAFVLTICFSLLPSALKFVNPEWIFKGNDRLITSYLIFFAIGACAGCDAEGFENWIKKKFRWITVSFIALAVIDLVMSYICYRALAKIYLLDQLHILYSISAILFCYGLANKKTEWCDNGLIKQIDGASYYIYLSHCFFIFIINHLMAYLELYAEKITYPIRTVFVYAVTILLCCGYVRLKNIEKFHKNREKIHLSAE